MTPSSLDGDIVGVDLGGTKIYAARLAIDGDAVEVVEHHKSSTPTSDADAVVDAVVDAVASVSPRPALVGLGAPGVIDSAAGVVVAAPNLAGFGRPVPMAARLAERLRCPVAIGNDVDVAALAETRVGAARGHRDVLAVWMGTGLGGGLVLDGRLRTGPHGVAGELGHVVVVPGGRPCHCGGVGHLEAYIGRRALEDRARALAAEGRGSELVELAGGERMKSKLFRQAYDDGDAVAVELLEEGLELLGVAVTNLAVTVDLDAVVVGGGLGERMSDEAIRWISAALAGHGLIATPPRVVAAALGEQAGAVGAGLLACETTPSLVGGGS